jgi:hypothetical protein
MSLDLARTKQAAQRGIRSLLSDLVTAGKYGQLEKAKPDNTIRVMFENFSSLRLFAQGKEKGRKIHQINKLMKDYNVDVMAGWETRVDWRFTKPIANRFDSLFAQGQQRRGVYTHNINEYVRQDQWGGTCMVAVGRIPTMVKATGMDIMGLGWWAWVYMGGGVKTMHVLVAYRPCQPHRNTGSDTVLEQHRHYFEAQGNTKSPIMNFQDDLS